MTLDKKYHSESPPGFVLHRTQKKDKRSKLEMYNDILLAINENTNNGTAKPTHVQFRSNMSYDNLKKYLNELEEKNLVSIFPLAVTEKGHRFLNDYGRIKDVIQKIGLDYL